MKTELKTALMLGSMLSTKTRPMGFDDPNPNPNPNPDPNPNPNPNPDPNPKPSDAEAKLLREVMALKAAKKAAEEKAAKYEGIDPEKARAALAAAQEAEAAKAENDRKELERKGEYDRIVAQMREQNEAAVKTVADAKAASDAALARALGQIDDLTIGSSFANSKFIGENLVLTPTKTKQLFGAHFEFADGKLVGYDKPKGADKRTPLVDAAGTPLDFEAALEKIVKGDTDFETFAKVKQKPGAASDSNANGNGNGNDDKKTETSGLSMIGAGLNELLKKKP